MPDYYKVDSRTVTLREYWNITRSWKALIPWIAARIGVPMSLGVAFALPKSVSEMEITEDQFSSEARAKLQPLVDQSLSLGFHSPRYYLHTSLRRDVLTHFVSMLHRSGQFSLRLMHSVASNASPSTENVLAVLLSELDDGTFFFTSDQRPKFQNPPGILINRLVGATPLQLIESHQERIAQLSGRNPPKPVASLTDLDDVWNRYEKVSTDFGLRRGLYVPVPPEEALGQEKQLETVQTLTTQGVRHADVLVELDALQNKKGGWGNALLLLIISLVLFVGAGSRQWSWDYLLILVPVLFIHELGHYLAMRAFQYRNLRMFFIPFFGAAVAGRHYNVPGWKKVIVSLMGPVPGIILGVMLGGAGMILHQPVLTKVALVTLILNGINLFPVLPLDGGWVFHTLLFSRHPLLDTGFRVVAALALLAGGMFSTDKILLYLGIATLIGIPAAHRMACITNSLRKRGLESNSLDDQTIPTETAVAIIDELKKDSKAARSNKLIAQQTLQVFENLNARPPGWLPTAGLLGAHIVSLGMAALFAGVFIVGRLGNIDALMAKAAGEPKRPIACGESILWRGPQASAEPAAKQTVIVANFSNGDAARSAFLQLTNRFPASAAAKTFGDSLFLTIPDGDSAVRKQWFTELEGLAATVFVDGSNAPTTFSVLCQLPTAQQAVQLEHELMEYLSAPFDWHLVPPWHPEDRRSLEQRAAHQLARKSYRKARDTFGDDNDDAKIRQLQKQLGAAQRQGDSAEIAAVRKQIVSRSNELRKERLEKLKTDPDEPMDPAIIDLHLSWSADNTSTNKAANEKTMQLMARRMGQLSESNAAIDQVAVRFSARSGYVFTKGPIMQMAWVSFPSISDAAPALLDWLCKQGASAFKYEITSSAALMDDEEQ